jgi:hypothetical protein
MSVGGRVSALSGGGAVGLILYPLGSSRNANVGIVWSRLGWGGWGCRTLHVIVLRGGDVYWSRMTRGMWAIGALRGTK